MTAWPTMIYLLIDIRPETIAKGWPNGFPFYCGKTTHRNATHLLTVGSARTPRPNDKNSHRLPDLWIRACGPHIQMKVMRVVPVGGDWVTPHRNYIRWLRTNFPGGANITDGGPGPTGYQWSAEQLKRHNKKVVRTKRQLSVERKRNVAERLKSADSR